MLYAAALLSALLGFAPADGDRDKDGLSDFHEIHKYFTDPDKADSDGDGKPDGDWDERREYQYTVRSVVQVMRPVTIEYLNDDFQDARVLRETEAFVELEVIHYPLNTVNDAIASDSDWLLTSREMKDWLRPGFTSDWTPALRKRVRRDLQAAGIDFKKLDDKSLVEKASRWLLQRAKYDGSRFCAFVTGFGEYGKPFVPKELKNDKNDRQWRDDWDRDISARGMYKHEIRGSCSSTSIYLSGTLRALGIPTRTVLVIPVIDATDEREREMVRKGITHFDVRWTLLTGLHGITGWTSHSFNEVYVGKRWRRLNYTRLGQNAYDEELFGLHTHIATFHDWADADMHRTIGPRQSKSAKALKDDPFGGRNPYSTVALDDQFGVHAKVKPPKPRVHEARVTQLLWSDDKKLPPDVRGGLDPRGRVGLVAVVEPQENWRRFRAIASEADGQATLETEGQTLNVRIASGVMWGKSRGVYVWVSLPKAERAKLKAGATYKLLPRNKSPEARWVVPATVTLER